MPNVYNFHHHFTIVEKQKGSLQKLFIILATL
jgi:hypothetical protein